VLTDEPSTANQAEGCLNEDEPPVCATLRRETLGWRIRASEVALILTHEHDLTKARAMNCGAPADPLSHQWTG
jgi:hypothetical protein